MLCTPKELLEFSNSHKTQISQWILRKWDNGGRKMKLDQARLIDMGSLSRGSAFNVAMWGVIRGSAVSLVG